MLKFAKRQTVEQVEEGVELAPKFDAQGVLPCVTMHAETREVLMVGYMNQEALTLTIETGLAHYWSRSREVLWKKGESSGMFQRVVKMLIDDDQDCVVIDVELTPPPRVETRPRVMSVIARASTGRCRWARGDRR